MTDTSDHRLSGGAGDTKTRIKRAALALFGAHGVDASTTRQIAAAAGLSEGALYRHFRSKDDLAEGLFFALHDRLASLVRRAGREHAMIDDQAKAVVDAYCQTADEDWPLFSYHLLSTHRFLPGAPAHDNPVAAVEEIVAAAMARGDIPERGAGLVAAMALGVVLQPALHKAYGRLDGKLGDHSPALKRGVLAVLHQA